MGFAEALSDDGSLTGRGHPLLRGIICGCMTAVGGIGHTLPFLTNRFTLAIGIAVAVVVVELGAYHVGAASVHGDAGILRGRAGGLRRSDCLWRRHIDWELVRPADGTYLSKLAQMRFVLRRLAR